MRAQKSREKIGSNAGTQRESKASEPPKQRAKGAAEIKLPLSWRGPRTEDSGGIHPL